MVTVSCVSINLDNLGNILNSLCFCRLEPESISYYFFALPQVLFWLISFATKVKQILYPCVIIIQRVLFQKPKTRALSRSSPFKINFFKSRLSSPFFFFFFYFYYFFYVLFLRNSLSIF